jgi:MFS family permease
VPSQPTISGPSHRSLVALATLNFFLADARDGLGPFLDGFLATHGWQPMTLGIIATIGGILGMIATPFFGALVDASPYKRSLIILPVILVTATALWTLASPYNLSVFGGQSVTALVAAVIGPALMGLTLGLVGQHVFSRQISNNEIWNHTGNVFSLICIYLMAEYFGQNGIVWLTIASVGAAIIAALSIRPQEIDQKVARGFSPSDDSALQPAGFHILAQSQGLIVLALII